MSTPPGSIPAWRMWEAGAQVWLDELDANFRALLAERVDQRRSALMPSDRGIDGALPLDTEPAVVTAPAEADWSALNRRANEILMGRA